MKKSLPILVVIAIFCAVALFSFRVTDRASAIPGVANTVSVDHPAVGQDFPVTKPETHRQATPSPPSWRPPEVFSKTGRPTPPPAFPRGENASRRYHETVSRDIEPGLSARHPSVLAKSPEDGRFHLLPEEIDTHTLAAARMVFDPTSLDRIVDGTTSSLFAPTLSGEVLTLEFQKIKTRTATTHTLQGHVAGEEATSLVQIVYHDGILHGTVMRYNKNEELEYRILADGHMMVRQLDHSTMTAGCSTCSGELMADVVDESAPGSDETYNFASGPQDPVTRDTAGWRTIDVTVGYTAEARLADGGNSQIEARIIASVDRMTLAFANSAIANTELILLGTIEDPDYVENTSTRVADAHVKLRNETDGYLDVVTDFHHQLGSDLASIIVSTVQTGGVAGVAVSGSWSSANSRSGLTSSQMVFEHELGHNLGCAHAWGDTSEGNTASNMGWRFQGTSGTKYSTIMAYTHVSSWGGRIPYYSNPNVIHPDGNVPTGCVNGYDATNDPTVDPYLKPGYNGSVPTRGANNASTIDTGDGIATYGATVASNRATRTNFLVHAPAAAARWEKGTTQTISFSGGDMDDLATILLYKGGLLHTTLASGVNPVNHRNFAWVIPFNLADGTDYMIRIQLNRNGSTLFADSGIFEIFSDLPHVNSASAPAVPAVIGQVSSLILTFNVPMNPASFNAGTDIVSFINPEGSSLLGSITGTSWSAGDTVLTIQFTPPSLQGSYQLAIGPDLEDTAGNKMDQDGDGTTGESAEDRFTATFNVNPPLIRYDNMDTNPGWTFSANNPVNGWAWGKPAGGTGYQSNYGINDPTSGYNGANVIGYNLTGDYERGITSTRWATTPAMDCSNYANVRLRFQRWLGVYFGASVYGAGTGDNAYIEVSNNGTTWTPVWHNTNSRLTSAGWVEVEYNISAVADGQSTVYVRWGMGTSNSSLNDDSCGWNIDEFIVHGDYVDNSDTTPPYPSPMTFASAPTALGVSAVTMTATTALDANGVEYYFDETSGNPGGTDSVWQDSPTYTDSGLQAGTQYTYTVKARDKSPGQNESGPSAPASATTDAGPTLTLIIAATSIGESGGPGASTATVTRNTDTSSSLVVNLSSNDTTEATVPATVTIAAGQSISPVFNVNAADDAIIDGTQSVTLTATATGHTNGSDTIDVNDDVPLTLTVVTGTNGASTSGGGLKDPDGSPFAITATPAISYSFGNWTVIAGDATFGIENNASTTMETTGDATVQANFVVTTYAVTYAGNGSDGGSVPVDASSPYNYNSTVTVLGNTGALTRTGYSFTGWNTASNGSGTSYVGGNTFSITGNTTLYAQWTPTIALGNLSQVYDGAPKSALVTTNPAGLAHTVTYNGSATAPANAGPYAVVATITDPSYSGSASGSLVIAKASQTITFGTLGTVPLSGTSIALTATSSSGLAVSYSSSNTAVATISGSNLNTIATGASTITASQAGDSNYNAATSVQQTVTVSLANPVAVPGGPYRVINGGSLLSLDGSASLASAGQTITLYEWDLNNDNVFGDVTGSNPAGIDFNTLLTAHAMSAGFNPIQLKVTDSANKTSIVSTTVQLVFPFFWDANGTGVGQTNGGAAWLGTNLWWNGTANTNWVSGSAAVFGGVSSNGGGVTLASPTTADSITFNTFTGTYTLGTAGQTITLNAGIDKTATSSAVSIISPITLTAQQTWANHSSGTLTVTGVIGGSGGITKTGTGTLLLNGAQDANNYTGNTKVTGGVLQLGTGWSNANNIPGGMTGSTGTAQSNLELNGGTVSIWYDMTRTLGTGSQQIQITGGRSGFTNKQGDNPTGNLKIGNNANTEIVWGSDSFKPTTFVMQDAAASPGTAVFNLDNKIDLNGATRTVEVGTSSGILSQIIRNSNGTAGLIKTGNGLLILSANNSYNGNTTVNAGTLRINIANTNNQSSSISIAAGATLHLGFTGTDTVDKLFVDGAQLAAGVYKAPGSAASGTELAQLAGTGTLTVTSAPPGPVDHFVISSIASPQSVGTPITGITLTAQDVSNNIATSFTGTVTFGGTAGITGTSANFVNGVLIGVSATPLNAGSGLTLTVDDGAGHTGLTTFTVQSTYDQWTGETFANPFSVTARTANPDNDALTNLQEFAFGTDPTSSFVGAMTFTTGINGSVTSVGLPVLQDIDGNPTTDDFRAVFPRRKDYLAAGLAYAAEFSADLKLWTASATGLQVLTGENSSSQVEAVSVPFPAVVPVQGGSPEVAPKFFRIRVSQN